MEAQEPLPRWLDKQLERTARDAREARRWASQLLGARAAGDEAGVYRAAVRAKQVAPRSPWIREALGLAAFAAGSWHESAQELMAYRRLTGRRDQDAVIAECYRRLGRASRAVEFLADLRRAEVDPDTWIRAQAAKARALADAGRRRVAISVLESLRLDAKASPDAAREAVGLLAELRAAPD